MKTSKPLFFLLLACTICALLPSRAEAQMQIIDYQGNVRPLSDLIVPTDAIGYDINGSTTSLIPYNNQTPSGYFQIYYRGTNWTQSQLDVIDQLLKDISALINSPLNPSVGETVNILLDDLASSTAAGAGTSFFCVPYNVSGVQASAFKGVLDNLVWLAIKSGRDPLTTMDFPVGLPSPTSISICNTQASVHSCIFTNQSFSSTSHQSDSNVHRFNRLRPLYNCSA